ncbi:MAG TPA: alkane 1-monooxygenase [Solimonas sp.]|nr:alkane 1-monooxygenase [Solimonas sp.]
MTSATLTQTPWVDGKRHLWTLGLVVPMLPLLSWGLVEATGWGLFWWFGPLFMYTVIPLLDQLVGDDKTNPPESVVPQLEEVRYYRWITYAYIPLQYANTAFGAWMAVRGGLAWWEILGLVSTVGVVNGIGINTAHELGHKKEELERWLAKLTLAPVAYGHFFVEHNRGHHVRVATPEDPASSRMGETFWQFLPRSMIGSLRSSWHLEQERLAREGKSVWHWQNHNLQAWGMTVLLFAALTLWLGAAALPFLLAQAFYGASLLEVVNYLEHYGLKRRKLADGRYERCQPQHSWNSNNVVTNLFLYQLQRHSDHHAHALRRYQSLRHFEEAPQLPAGYAALIPLAYVPSLWFRVMDPRVVAHYGGDLSQANLQPEKREALLSRYTPSALARAA